MVFSDNIFEKENFVLKVNSEEATFSKFGPEFKIDMKIKLKAFPSSGRFGNILRVTNTNGNYGTKGDRYPALFVHPNNHFHFTSSIDDNSNHHTDSSSVALNRWYEISIEQRKYGYGEYKYEIFIDDKRLESKVFWKPLELKTAKLYLSDQFHEEAKVEFDYLRIFY